MNRDVKVVQGPIDEGALAEAGEILLRHVTARAELPALLADLCEAGEREAAVQAICDWGRGARSVIEIWQDTRARLARLSKCKSA